MSQRNYKPHYEHLKNKWQDRHKALQQEILTKHGEAFEWLTHHLRNFSVGAVGALLLILQQPTIAASTPPVSVQQNEAGIDLDKDIFLVTDLSHILPKDVRVFSSEEEERITQVLSNRFGFRVVSEFNGKRLNRSYGLIGAEQHLARYPGDDITTHFASVEEASAFWGSGMAPGLGAWRYFSPSQNEMTQKDSDREKYYIAVQTFLAPGFHDNPKDYSDFFRFRKMLVVNPQNGKALIAAIGDAGPAEWTGKQLGGSPEVMEYLQRVDGKQIGPVLYFFIDDPSDTIPLGPVHVQ